MPSPQLSSLLNSEALQKSPYREWLKLTSTADEFGELTRLFAGIPRPWLTWVEAQVQSEMSRGIVVRSPLNYRLSVLWNGVIYLQELKFICDMLENALRQAFVSVAESCEISNSTLGSMVPKWSDVVSEYGRCFRQDVAADEVCDAQIVLLLSFYQLTETMRRYWESGMAGREPQMWHSSYAGSELDVTKAGFGAPFWNLRECRDSNLFGKEMKEIRALRNEMAHSRRLFRRNEVRRAFKIANRWLVPLEIPLEERVLKYRENRPRFLESIAG